LITLESAYISVVVVDKLLSWLPSTLESAELCLECVLTGLILPSLMAMPSEKVEKLAAATSVSANGVKSVATFGRANNSAMLSY